MTSHVRCRAWCTCGWRGPWRTNVLDANKDKDAHCDESGCARDEERMPHEH